MHVIISRHPAAVEFLRAECPEFAEAPVLATATPDDVRGMICGGNLPLHLAALAAEVVAVEFDGQPPRGQEYGPAEMRAAGARVARYRVTAVESACPTREDVEAARCEAGAASRKAAEMYQGYIPATDAELAAAQAASKSAATRLAAIEAAYRSSPEGQREAAAALQEMQERAARRAVEQAELEERRAARQEELAAQAAAIRAAGGTPEWAGGPDNGHWVDGGFVHSRYR